MLQRTPLHEIHRAAGARMVDFGGWDMPLHYGSQIDEHHAVRRSAGMFDVSHMRIVDLAGPAAREFLRLLLANDVGRLVEGRALYSCMLADDGGVLDDLIAYSTGPQAFRLVVNAATAVKDLAWIEKILALHGFDCVLEPRPELALISVQGPQARERLARVLPRAAAAIGALQPFSAAAVDGLFVARTGYTGEDGCELALDAGRAADLWRALARDGVIACGLGARDTLRLEAGMNLYGQDMDESVTPLESGLAWTVDLRTAREFIGRAALEAQQAAGGLRRLVGLVLRDRSAGVLRAHQRVVSPHGGGEVTSGSFAPSLGLSIALARVPGAAVAQAEPATLTVEMRARPVAVEVVKPPFVRHGRSLIANASAG